MERIIKRINEEITHIKSGLTQLDHCTNMMTMDLALLENFVEKPNEFYLKELKNYLSDESSVKIDYILKLKDFFDTNPEESQIIKAKKYLMDVSREYAKLHHDRALVINKIYNIGKRKIEILNNLLNKVNDYDSNTYIIEDEFLLISKLFNNQAITDDVVNEFLTIGKNNSIIKAREEIMKSLVSNNESLDDDNKYNLMDQDRKEKNKLDKFFENIEYLLEEDCKKLEILFQNMSVVEDIKNILMTMLSMKKKVTKDGLETGDLFKSEFETIEEKEEYYCALVLNILDAIEFNNLDDALKVIEKHKLREEEENKKEKQFDLVKTYIEDINLLKEHYYDEQQYLNFCLSYSEYSEDEIINALGINEYFRMKIMKLFYEIDTNNYELAYVENVLFDIKSEIDKYELMIKSEEVLEEEKNDEVDFDSVKNYVVLLSEERIRENIDEILYEHPEVNISLFSGAIRKLLDTPHTNLLESEYCKPIKESYNKNNQYGIREGRSGIIRIAFRTINTLDGHVVYELLAFAYGSCDGRTKSENLRASIKEYESYKSEYDKLEKNVKSNTLSKNSTLITAGLTFYNKLVEESQKGVGEK